MGSPRGPTASLHGPGIVFRARATPAEISGTARPAAGTLDKAGPWISYAITLNGPEPEEALRSSLDYHHYLDRQLAPAVDGLLQLFDTSFASLTAKQMEMF